MAKKSIKKLTKNLETNIAAKPCCEAASFERTTMRTEHTGSPAKILPGPAPSEAGRARLEAPMGRKGQVPFVLLEPEATRVTLSGEFNGWSPEATPMKKDEQGRWTTTIALPAGRYEYKFVVDGQWIPDPNAPEQALNPYGTINSVVEVRS